MKRLLPLLALAAACASAMPRTATMDQPRTLEALLRPIDGGPAVQAQVAAGKVVLLNVWASWSQPSSAELPYYAELQDELGAQGVAVITINVDADQRAAEAFLRDLNLQGRLTVLHDPEAHQVERSFAIQRLPTTYFIDRQGQVRYVQSGFSENERDRIRQQVQDLLGEPRS